MYNCMDEIKVVVNACERLTFRRAKRKALHPQRMQGKRKARQRGRGVIVSSELDFMTVKKRLHFVVVVFCQLVVPLIIRNVICDTGKVFFLVACKIEILIAF